MPLPRSSSRSSRSRTRNPEQSEFSTLRVPPHNGEAEIAVLGAIFLDAERVIDLCLTSDITPESFYAPQNRALYETILQLHGAGKAIDAVTVSDALRDAGLLDMVGGVDGLNHLVDATPTSAHAAFYVEVLREKHLLRTIIQVATDAQTKCYDDPSKADTILSETEQAVLAISEKQKSDALSWKEAIRDTIRRVEHGFDHGPESLAGISTGLKNLDRLMYGLRPGEMIVLAARPSMGKTSLAMNICENVALGTVSGKEGTGARKAVGIFSCEMSQQSLVMRMLCAHAQLNMREINQGFGNQAAIIQKLTRAASELEKASIVVDDTSGLDVMDLRARARRMKKQFGVELIMIDYLQLLNSREYAAQGRQLETSNISSNIKAMAKELNLPVIVLSQLSRSPEKDKSGKPKLSDLRDSGAIEQDADVVLLLRRPCKNPGDPEFDDKRLAYVDVAKHRNGPTGEAVLDFEDQYTKFTDRAGSYYGAQGNEVAMDTVEG